MGLPMSSGEYRGLSALLTDATQATAAQPSVLRLLRRTGFIFDPHGDFASVEAAIEYCRRHDLDFAVGGDVIDKIYEPGGGLKSVVRLAQEKVDRSDRVHLLKGDHETDEVNGDMEQMQSPAGWLKEMNRCGVMKYDSFFGQFFASWSNAAYTSDVLVVHAGLPDIRSMEDLADIPKSSSLYSDMRHCQLLMNDHWVPHMLEYGITREDVERLVTVPARYRDNRDVEDNELPFVYGNAHFDRVMDLLKKNVLVRGHNHHANGISGSIITLHTNQHLGGFGLPLDQGGIRGVYMAVIDPDKKVTSAADVELINLK